jgi:regulator of protease activity HflC (stomatin/prohibitin superfamily)
MSDSLPAPGGGHPMRPIPRDEAGALLSTVTPTREIAYSGFRVHGMLGLLLCLPLILFFGLGLILLRGLVLVEPNQARVVLLFGKYMGTIKEPGFYFINPLCSCKPISLRVNNFDSARLKVNDARGNPVEIGAVVVWRVHDTAQASFDVQHYDSYVAVQTEAAIRTAASKHPYDSSDPGVVSLRGDSQEVNAELLLQLRERLSHAGVEVLEVRLSHLAYASEIAGVMLRRQQAEAIIDARQRIVEGAVGMVKLALDNLEAQKIVALDQNKRAALVSNLLVVLCSESDVQPVVRTDSG